MAVGDRNSVPPLLKATSTITPLGETHLRPSATNTPIATPQHQVQKRKASVFDESDSNDDGDDGALQDDDFGTARPLRNGDGEGNNPDIESDAEKEVSPGSDSDDDTVEEESTAPEVGTQEIPPPPASATTTRAGRLIKRTKQI